MKTKEESVEVIEEMTDEDREYLEKINKSERNLSIELNDWINYSYISVK